MNIMTGEAAAEEAEALVVPAWPPVIGEEPVRLVARRHPVSVTHLPQGEERGRN